MISFRLCCLLLLAYLGMESECTFDDVVKSEEKKFTCSDLIANIAESNLHNKIVSPPKLTGKWVSENCETRSGPQFLLRSYSFFQNETFRLLQIYYKDDSCTSPLYTIVATGSYKIKLRLPSIGAFKLSYDISKVTLSILDMQIRNELTYKLNETCPGLVHKGWRHFREYLIYPKDRKQKPGSEYNKVSHNSNNYELFTETNLRNRRKTYSSQIYGDHDGKCYAALNISFNELLVIRVQNRKVNIKNARELNLRYELLLGNMYSSSSNIDKRRSSLTPSTTFQLPLLLVNDAYNCSVCRLLSNSNNMFVPHLTAKPSLPFFISGQWISGSCEMGLTDSFLTRHVGINPQIRAWQIEYRYYSNYLCSKLLIIYVYTGSYSLGSISNKMSSAFDLDFEIEKSFLMIMDKSLIDVIQNDPICGIPGYWKVGVMKEIPSRRRGCSSLDFVPPSVKHDIAKVDIDSDGTPLLYTGQQNTPSMVTTLDTTDYSEKNNRPTSYQYPLIQCTSQPFSFSHYPYVYRGGNAAGRATTNEDHKSSSKKLSLFILPLLINFVFLNIIYC